MRLLAAQRRPELVKELPAALADAPLRIEAIRAIAQFDDVSLANLLLARFPTFDAAEKSEAVQTLSARVRYARLLTEAIATGAVARQDVPPHLARQLRRVVGVKFADVWGPIDERPAEDRAYARYRGMLSDAAVARADAINGRSVFRRTCGSCHKLYGEGGAIGPDLTGSNRANLDYVLSNVLNPSGEIQDAYRMAIVTMRDGRTHTGTLVVRKQSTDHAAGRRARSRRHPVVRDPAARGNGNIDDAARALRRARGSGDPRSRRLPADGPTNERAVGHCVRKQ